MAFAALQLGGFGNIGRRLPNLLPSLLPKASSITLTCLDRPKHAPDDFEVPESVDYNYVRIPHDDPRDLLLSGTESTVLQDDTIIGLDYVIQPASLDIIISTSGHWLPSSLPSPTSTKDDVQAFTSSYASLHASCVEPAILALALAGRYLKPTGTLVLTGAAASIPPVTDQTCGGMVTYGLNKAFTGTIARYAGTKVNTVVYHPETVDTAANRLAMPDADRSEWNDVDGMLEGVMREAIESGEGPSFGEFRVVTRKGVTEIVKVE